MQVHITVSLLILVGLVLPQSNSITVSVSPEPTVPIISVNGGNTSFCQGGSATLQVTNVCTGCSYTWYPSGSGTTITVNSAGTYYCTSSNSCGGPSSQSNSISITVNPSPTTPVISTQGGIISFCQGTGSVTLQVTNICTGCSYTWYPSGSGTSFNVTNAGTYYCTSSNSCGGPSPQSNSITIIVNKAPNASFTLTNIGNREYQFNDNSSGFPISWNWNFGDPTSGSNTSASQNPQHTFTSNGYYTICLLVANTCDNNTICNSITVTAIDNLNNSQSLSILPNPISESAIIQFSLLNYEKVSITLYDVFGRKIIDITESDFSSGTHEVKIDKTQNLSAGIYFVKFISKEFSETSKIIIQ